MRSPAGVNRMHIHGDTPLRSIASAGEAARRALDRAGLDYCCEGDLSLADACLAAGVEEEAIEAELSAVEPAADWSHRELSAVLDRVLGVCHPRTRRLLSEALVAASAFLAGEPRARALVEALGALASHALNQMREEEETLYARVKALADARLGRGPYPPPPFRTIHEHGARLWEGHKRTHDDIRRVRKHLAELPSESCADLRARTDAALTSLTEQMHLENNEILPRARDLEPNGERSTSWTGTT